MIAQMARNAAFVAGLALLSGCGVSQSQLDQRTTELKAYTDQKMNASQAATQKELANVKATSEEVRSRAEMVLKVVQMQETDIRQNRETLRNMLEAQSVALDQQKRTVDALIQNLKAAPSAPNPPAMPATSATPGVTR